MSRSVWKVFNCFHFTFEKLTILSINHQSFATWIYVTSPFLVLGWLLVTPFSFAFLFVCVAVEPTNSRLVVQKLLEHYTFFRLLENLKGLFSNVIMTFSEHKTANSNLRIQKSITTEGLHIEVLVNTLQCRNNSL